MRAVGKKVLVRQDPPSDKVGRFYVPQGSETYDNTGTVEAVGPEVQADIKTNDRVVFQRKASTAFDPHAKEGDELYGLLCLPEDNILAVIEES